MARKRTAGLNDEQVMHAMSIDDAYSVDRVLAEKPMGITECVSIDGSGPYVRKKIPRALVNRTMWAQLASCKSLRLPQVLTTYELPDYFVVVYDYVPGDTLEHIVSAQGGMSAPEAIETAQEIAEALEDLHAHGIIHCDISPANIIIAADGAHVIDLSIAQVTHGAQYGAQDGVLYPTGQIPPDKTATLGTWGFASPEQYGFARVDERSDVYGLAKLLGYMLTGAFPNDAAYDAKLGAGVNSADAWAAVAPALAGIVQKGSAFEPSARYQTMGEFGEALRVANDALAIPTYAAPTTEPVIPAGSPTASTDNSVGGAVSGASQNTSASKQQPTQPYNPYAAASTSYDGPSSSTSGATLAKHQRNPKLIVAVAVAVVVVIVAIIMGVNAASNSASSNNSDTIQDEPAVSTTNKSSAQEDDSSSAASSASASSSSKKENSLVITESGWSTSKSGYVNYGCAYTNTSNDYAIQSPTINIVGRDKEGKVVFTDDFGGFLIEPGQTMYYGTQAGNGVAPATVDFTIPSLKDYQLIEPSSNPLVFSIFNLNDSSDDTDTYFTGEIALKSGEYPQSNMGSIAVSVILRDKSGAIIYGDTTYVEAPTANRSVVFDIDIFDAPEYDSFEVYAQSW